MTQGSLRRGHSSRRRGDPTYEGQARPRRHQSAAPPPSPPSLRTNPCLCRRRNPTLGDSQTSCQDSRALNNHIVTLPHPTALAGRLLWDRAGLGHPGGTPRMQPVLPPTQSPCGGWFPRDPPALLRGRKFICRPSPSKPHVDSGLPEQDPACQHLSGAQLHPPRASLPTARGSSEHAPRSLAPGANTNTPGTTQPFIWETDRHLGAPPPAHPGLCPAKGTGENIQKLQRGGGVGGKRKKEKREV